MPTTTRPVRLAHDCVLRTFVRTHSCSPVRRTIERAAFELKLSMRAAINEALIADRRFSPL